VVTDYDNTNKGVLFKNDRKENDKHPDYKGSINIDGAEFWLDAWINEARTSGKKFMSLRIKPKLPGGQTKPATQKTPDPEPEFSDEIPF
jgi:uncharacterized protein (DUF736 family)